jgi:SAM-dependent methyltransferase
MTTPIWEDFISLNSQAQLGAAVLGPARDYVALQNGEVRWDTSLLPLERALSTDTAPLPTTDDREGYYGANHYNYWASGLRDYSQLLEWTGANGVNITSLLDIGCASGRFLRHVQHHGCVKTIYGCDINRLHIDWIAQHLPKDIIAFQNTSIPSLPLPDACLDAVTAFSVFTHVECFDTTWLMELRRVLRPGGIAWISVHGDRTWKEIKPTWPLYAALSSHPDYAKYRENNELAADRLVFRWISERSYSSNIFYTYKYIRNNWGRLLDVKNIIPARPEFQDIVILQKPVGA